MTPCKLVCMYAPWGQGQGPLSNRLNQSVYGFMPCVINLANSANYDCFKELNVYSCLYGNRLLILRFESSILSSVAETSDLLRIISEINLATPSVGAIAN